MRLLRITIPFLIGVILFACNPPDFWTTQIYYVENLSVDSIVCVYHVIYNGNNIDTISHTNEIAPQEISVLRHLSDSESDTIFIDTFFPHWAFEDMLFLSIQGDTILYISPIVDSDWEEENKTKFGSKWIYKFNNK